MVDSRLGTCVRCGVDLSQELREICRTSTSQVVSLVGGDPWGDIEVHFEDQSDCILECPNGHRITPMQEIIARKIIAKADEGWEYDG